MSKLAVLVPVAVPKCKSLGPVSSEQSMAGAEMQRSKRIWPSLDRPGFPHFIASPWPHLGHILVTSIQPKPVWTIPYTGGRLQSGKVIEDCVSEMLGNERIFQ